MQDGILLRARIQGQIKHLDQYTRIVMSAPAGYGKTTAIRGFLHKNCRQRYVWVSFAHARDHRDWMWNEFCTAVAMVNAPLAEFLWQYGAPEDEQACRYVAQTIARRISKLTLFVFDDLQWCAEERIQQFVRTFVSLHTATLRFACLTRAVALEQSVRRLATDKATLFLGAEDLRFTLEETRQYFTQNGAAPNDFLLAQIYAETAGIPAAVQLAQVRSQTLWETGSGIPVHVPIHEILDRFGEEELRILLCLEPLGSCTMEEAAAAAGTARAGALLAELSGSRWFVQYDANSRRFYLHSLLLRALQATDVPKRPQPKRVLRKVADWQAATGDVVAAIRLYTRGEAWAGVLRIMERTGASEYFDLAPGVFIQAFEHMPEEKKQKHPFAYLTFLHDYMLMDETGSAVHQIQQMKEAYEAGEELPCRSQILGEIALIESFLYFNEVRRMAAYHQKAFDLFAGKHSRIFHRDMVFTFGSPGLLAQYYRQAGGLQSLLKAFDERFTYFPACTNGCGAGARMLLHAETAYQQGDLEKGKEALRQARVEAAVHGQDSLLLSGCFLELRILAATGCWNAFRQKRNAFEAKYASSSVPLLQSAASIGGAYLDLLSDAYDNIPQQIKEFDLRQIRRLPQAQAWLCFLAGRVLLAQKKIRELEALAKELLQMESAEQYFFIKLSGHLFLAVAQAALQGRAAGMESFMKALELARADQIRAIFMEMAEHTIPFLEDLWYRDPFAKSLLLDCRTYEARRAVLRRPKALTAQEQRIMQAIADGAKRDAIARELGISINTVKKHVANIYKKLGVSRQTQALKKLRRIQELE